MASVVLEGVAKGYAGTMAVDGVSLRIESGEFVTLLGPSGCGKTTTLRIVAGLVAPEAGRVLIKDRDVTRIPTHERNIGMVFQSHALFPHMTIADNVGFGLRMRGVPRSERRDRIVRALELVRLGDFGGRFPAQLSGGQQQRVALARAIVFDPHVLLLDEPFGALDRQLREALQVELRALTRRIGMTAIFVTHDQEEALILSDRVAVMRAGRIEQIAPPQELFERPATRFVADFMGFSNLLPGKVKEAAADRALVDVRGWEVAALPEGSLQVGEDVTLALRAERIALAPAASAQSGGPAGVIADVVYQGTVVTYRVTLDRVPDVALTVREPAPAGTSLRFTAGDRVVASCPPGAIRILRG